MKASRRGCGRRGASSSSLRHSLPPAPFSARARTSVDWKPPSPSRSQSGASDAGEARARRSFLFRPRERARRRRRRF